MSSNISATVNMTTPFYMSRLPNGTLSETLSVPNFTVTANSGCPALPKPVEVVNITLTNPNLEISDGQVKPKDLRVSWYFVYQI